MIWMFFFSIQYELLAADGGWKVWTLIFSKVSVTGVYILKGTALYFNGNAAFSLWLKDYNNKVDKGRIAPATYSSVQD